MKRKAVIMLCAFLFVFAAVLGACGKKSHVESILKKGSYCAHQLLLPPLQYLNEEGQAMGVDIDLAKAVAGELGVSLKVEVLPFDELLEALEDGKGDMAISAFTVSQDRKELTTFQGNTPPSRLTCWWRRTTTPSPLPSTWKARSSPSNRAHRGIITPPTG